MEPAASEIKEKAMARTKKQAAVARAESAQRSNAVNDGRGCRVDIINDNERADDEIIRASGSERARRAARRDNAKKKKMPIGTEDKGRKGPASQT